MSKELIITDDVNLEIKDKSLLSHDSIYKSKDGKTPHINIADAKNNTIIKNGVYAILSVADKPINNRLYDYESLKLNVMNRDWVNPYKRPFLRNHDLYYEPSGRIVNAWFVDHKTMQVSYPNGQTEIPTDVIEHYKNLKCFDQGTGSTIVEVSVTEDTYNRINNGLDATVSQSSYMGKATCSICHQDYFGGECTHFAGNTYKIEKDKESLEEACYVECKDFEPIELSIVNNPANNSSILFVSSSKNNASKDKNEKTNNIADSKIDNENISATVKGTENNIKDCEQKDSQDKEIKNKMEDSMFKDLLKRAISKTVSDKFGENNLEKFEKLFDSLENEKQIENLQIFLDSLNIGKDEPEVNNSEPETKDETLSVENTENTENKVEEKEPETDNSNKKEEKVEDKKDLESAKADSLNLIYSEKNTTVKDSLINKKIAAMLKNL